LTEGFKRCIGDCNEIKPLSEFGKRKDSPDGYRNQCKDCRKKYEKQWMDENKEYIKKYKKQYGIDNKEELKRYKHEWDKNNSERIKELFNEWVKNNPDKVKIIKKRWIVKNPDYHKEYNQNNKDIRNKQTRKRRKEDSLFKLKETMRGMLKRTLKLIGTKKEGRTVDNLRYSPLQLKQRLEMKFTDGMTHQNHGQYGENIWNCDHIIPINNFKPDTPVHIINSLDNLQPMWSIPNFKKHDEILIHEQESKDLFLIYTPYLKDEVVDKYNKLIAY